MNAPENIVFLKMDDEVRKILFTYTSKGAITVISDNPFVSVLVEYNNNGDVVHMHVDTDPKVKELK